jgi:hypothetical protein
MKKTIFKLCVLVSFSIMTTNVVWARCTTTTMWKDGGGNLNVIWQDDSSQTATYNSGGADRQISNKAADDLINSAEKKGRRVKQVTYNTDGDDADCY